MLIGIQCQNFSNDFVSKLWNTMNALKRLKKKNLLSSFHWLVIVSRLRRDWFYELFKYKKFLYSYVFVWRLNKLKRFKLKQMNAILEFALKLFVRQSRLQVSRKSYFWCCGTRVRLINCRFLKKYNSKTLLKQNWKKF